MFFAIYLVGLGLWPAGHTVLYLSPCIVGPGFLCQGFVLSQNGTTSFSFGQRQGMSLYNVQFACSANTTSVNNSLYIEVIKNGAVFANGAVINISNLQCYSANNIPLSNLQSGMEVSSYIWLKYTNSSSSTNYTALRVAAINAKVV